MKTYSVGICEKDLDYAGALMDYANSRRSLGLRLYIFSGIRAVRDYLSVENLDLIITDNLQDFSETQDGYSCDGVKVAFLSEFSSGDDGREVESGKLIYIYKYQRAEIICRQIRNLISVENQSVIRDALCIGVYSPIGRCGKTNLAKALAIEDSTRGGLYVAMEDFGTNPDALGNEILYLIKSKSPRLEEALVQQIKIEAGIHTLHLSGTYLDTHDVNAMDMELLRTSLLQPGRYPCIVFDIGSAALTDLSILESFDKLYVPVLRDHTSTKKFEVFMKLLKDMELRSVITKINVVDVPDAGYASEEMKAVIRGLKHSD